MPITLYMMVFSNFLFLFDVLGVILWKPKISFNLVAFAVLTPFQCRLKNENVHEEMRIFQSSEEDRSTQCFATKTMVTTRRL